jgi:hypothetical protein
VIFLGDGVENDSRHIDSIGSTVPCNLCPLLKHVYSISIQLVHMIVQVKERDTSIEGTKSGVKERAKKGSKKKEKYRTSSSGMTSGGGRVTPPSLIEKWLDVNYVAL